MVAVFDQQVQTVIALAREEFERPGSGGSLIERAGIEPEPVRVRPIWGKDCLGVRSMTTTDPTTTDTYRKIAARLTMLRPQIDLKNYFAGPNPDVRLYDEKPYIRHQLEKYGVAAATTTLDGVTFLPKDWEELIKKLRIAKTTDGFDAFAEGQSPEKASHWALDLSMAATIGKGFREIWRPKLSDRPLSTRDLPGRHGFGLGRDRGQWSDAELAIRQGPAAPGHHLAAFRRST
ncbi:hypothetical protein ABIF68_009016 [Bradyrhizobium japonicum]